MSGQRSVELEEGRITYRVLGESGRPVVLLHGGGLDNGGWTWRWLAPELATDHRVFVPDHPKHGGSWPWKGRADQRGQEYILERLLDHWGLESATLIGLSLGSATSLGFALRRPERVDRLVLTSCGGIQDRVASHELAYLSLRTPMSWLLTRMCTPSGLERWVLTHVAFSDDVPAEEITELAAMAAEEYRAKRRWNGHMFCDWNRFEIGFRRMRTDFMARVGNLSCPVLFVHGAEDSAVPVRFPREAAGRVSHGRLEVIEGAGHFVPIERPTEYGAVVRSFLAEAPR
ncbi:alpha/beta hydrolase [Streptomonospora sediminis]